MDNCDILVIPSSKVTLEQINQITQLMQKRLRLSADIIKRMIMDKDKLYLYYESDSQKLVGMVCTKIIELDSCVIAYYGGTVIDKNFLHSHFLPYAIQSTMKYVYLKHPIKKKYHAALASSPGSFIYFSRFKPSWPNPQEKTPENVFEIMRQTIKVLSGEYKISDHYIISTELTAVIEDSLHKENNANENSYFAKLNPNYNKGEQLLVLARFTLQQLANFMFYAYHDALIKKKKNYRKIKRIRFKQPRKTVKSKKCCKFASIQPVEFVPYLIKAFIPTTFDLLASFSANQSLNSSILR